MPRLDAGNVSRMRVWIIPPTARTVNNNGTDTFAGYVFPLNWGGWVECRRLVFDGSCSATSLVGGMGDASFKLMRSVINEVYPRNGDYAWDDSRNPIIPGCWVCITSGSSPLLVPSSVLWIGTIEAVQGDEIKGTLETVGTVHALEIGNMLDRINVRNFQRLADNNYPATINSPPTANMAGRSDRDIIGNAVLGQDNNANPVYVFQPVPAACGQLPSQYWTRWRLLNHVVAFCVPDAISTTGSPVKWSIQCIDGSQATDPTYNPAQPKIAPYLNDTAVPEVLGVQGLTIKGMLDLLIPRCFSLGWKPLLFATSGSNGAFTVNLWIVIYSLNDALGYGVPAFGQSGSAIAYNSISVDATTEPIVKVQPRSSSEDQPDEIVVEGGNIIFGCSVSQKDGNLGIGWTASQQTLYQVAASSDSGYSALTDDIKLDHNRALRQSAWLQDVFTRFVLTPANPNSTNGALMVYDLPGRATGAQSPMCPQVVYLNGNTYVGYKVDSSTGQPLVPLANDPNTNMSPYLPTATLSRTLPWIVGFKPADGQDARPNGSAPYSSFLTPRLFYYDSTKPAGQQWIDLLAKGGTRPTPSIDVDDRGPAFRIVYDKPERLGVGLYNLSSDGLYDTHSETLVEGTNSFDWTKLVATIAVTSDQKLSAIRWRPGVKARSDVRRSITIKDPTLQCWVMLRGSILGVKTDGTPDDVSVSKSDIRHYVTRSDYARANRMADRLAAWAFRKRTAVTVTRMRPDAPPAWATVGTAIYEVIERQASNQGSSTGISKVSLICNTVVEAVKITGGDKPRLEITTSLPIQPEASGGGGSPYAGGPVSMTLGGTVPQAVQGAQAAAIAATADGLRTPLITPYNPGGSTASIMTLYVIGGNAAQIGNSLDGIQYASVVTPTAVYDPEVTTVYPAGLGYGYLFINGIQQPKKVLIRHSFAGISFPVLQGAILRCPNATTTLTFGGTPMTAYLFDWM